MGQFPSPAFWPPDAGGKGKNLWHESPFFSPRSFPRGEEKGGREGEAEAAFQQQSERRPSPALFLFSARDSTISKQCVKTTFQYNSVFLAYTDLFKSFEGRRIPPGSILLSPSPPHGLLMTKHQERRWGMVPPPPSPGGKTSLRISWGARVSVCGRRRTRKGLRERKPVVPPPSLSLNYTTIRSTAEREKRIE